MQSVRFTTLSSHKRGFTLIELMVTITIIAVLSAISLVVYTGAIKQGNDSKRQSDLRSVQSALEQYFADQFNYPATVTFSGGALSYGGKTYLNTIPSDPTGNPQYSYVALPSTPSPCDNLSAATKCTSYCLYAKLQSSSPGVGNCAALGSYNFAVTPP